MIKRLLFLISFLFSVTALFAQTTGSIKGKLTTGDGQPGAYVTVRIDRSNKGAISNEKGEYIIKNVKPGNWTLKISAVDAVAQDQAVTVAAGQTATVDFVLNSNAAQLHEVTISDKASRRETRTVAKLPLKNLENPQVYTSVSAELMKQQGVTNFDDAMRNVPGLSRTWESTGRGGDGGTYFSLRGFEAQPNLINGLPGLTSGNLDPAGIEEIQVMKGPSGTLFGGSFYGYGGIINTITKKPYYKFGGEVAYNIGSFDLHRLTVDVNTPLSKTKKIAMRVNAALHTEGSFQDAGNKKSFYIAPSFVYEVNNRLKFDLMVEVLEEKRAAPPVFFHSNRFDPLHAKTIEAFNLNNKLSFTSNDLTIRNPRTNVQGQMQYKLSQQWNSQTVVSYGTVKSDGIYTYIWDDSVPDDNWYGQDFHNENQHTKTLDIQQNFNGDFKIGNMRNRLLVGLDYFNRSVRDNGSGWATGRLVTPQGDVAASAPYPAPVPLNRYSIDTLLASSGSSLSKRVNSSYSAYASNVLNLTPGLMVMVSLRADYFDTKDDKNTPDDDEGYSQFAVSPKFGVVYQPVLDKVSIFANYMNAFINVAPADVFDADGNKIGIKSFKPEHANQWEGGVKANLLDDKLQATVSVYNTKVSNRVIPDGAYNSRQGGAVRSKGIEFDINANPAPGLNLVAGYSHIDIKVVEGDPDDFYSEPGRAPGGQGPQNLANLWATYKFTHGALKDFGLGLGGNYGSKYRVIDNSKTGVFDLPSYALLNGSVFYNSKKIRVAVNVNNITGETWYIGYWSVNPQKPRNFVASLAYKF
ncbi:TonB-dependent receptor [Chitinophaga niabensis]|uniref:Iron complex outermembrane recepter protein n=1 Tax=Chitinophaga niabensis TaxID=536979 RepID=A0A1N6DJ76_9BACT|nr:TonB-dependent receptor [Chitinophaga niabensis]SIN70879.1 iron complex outermembrane recepter protein [Chitinophaga niabensis]